jgi:Mrp family chromosome partitioning ATPase
VIPEVGGESTLSSDLLASPAVLQSAARLAAGVDPFRSVALAEGALAPRVAAATATLRRHLGEEGTSPDASALAALAREIGGSLLDAGPSSSGEVRIRCEGETEEEALLRSWALTEAVIQREREAREKRSHALERSIAEARERLAAARDAAESEQRILDDLRGRFTAATIDEEVARLEELRLRLNGQDQQLRLELERNEERIRRGLQEQALGASSPLPARTAETPLLRQIARRLIDARIDLDRARTPLSALHPIVLEKQEIVDGLEALLRETRTELRLEEERRATEETYARIAESATLETERGRIAERTRAVDDALTAFSERRERIVPVELALAERRAASARLESELAAALARAESSTPAGGVPGVEAALQAEPREGSRRGSLSPPVAALIAALVLLALAIGPRPERATVDDEEVLRAILDLPLLGCSPRASGASGADPRFPDESCARELQERFHAVAALLRAASEETTLRSIAVTSAIDGEGKSTVAIHLALALARGGSRVVLVDGDLRRGRLHEFLGMANGIGVSTLLGGEEGEPRLIEGVLTDGDADGTPQGTGAAVQRSPFPDLDLVASGPRTRDPIELLGSARLRARIADLEERYDFVILDTPPLNEGADALTGTTATDGTLLVVGAGKVRESELRTAEQLLANARANLFGMLLNRAPRSRSPERPARRAPAPPGSPISG